MKDGDALALLPAIAASRRKFSELVVDVRPELHRYASRMTGSVFDGEDVVQDALAKAYYALGEMDEPPSFKPWLFRIVHNAAMDVLRRYDRKNVELFAEVPERVSDEEPRVDPELLEAALSVFVELPPVQRSALILKDVLGHSLEEVATTLETTVGAVKAALSRARENVLLSPGEKARAPRPASAEEQINLDRYVALFNDRNWDGLRALVGSEAQLDLVSRLKKSAADAHYYDHYAAVADAEGLRAERGFVDGTPAIAIFRPASSPIPAYYVLLGWKDDRVALIRDFRYVPYIVNGSRFTNEA